MIDVHRLNITRIQLESLTSAERELFLLSCHALNSLALWMRLVRMAATDGPYVLSEESEDLVAGTMRATQVPLLVRSLIGSLWEAKVWLKKRGGFIRSAYWELMPPDAQESWEAADRIFKTGRLEALRNSVSFHYPSVEQLDAGFRRSCAVEDWSLYVTDQQTSSCYLPSENVMMHIRADDRKAGSGASELTSDIDVVVPEAIGAAAEMMPLFNGLLLALIRRHFAEIQMTLAIRVQDSPHIDDCALPFFLEWPSPISDN